MVAEDLAQPDHELDDEPRLERREAHEREGAGEPVTDDQHQQPERHDGAEHREHEVEAGHRCCLRIADRPIRRVTTMAR